jgi:hypothetical protein
MAPQGLAVDEESLSVVVKHIKREARYGDAAQVADILLDCSVQLSTKAPVYALVIGERASTDCPWMPLAHGWHGLPAAGRPGPARPPAATHTLCLAHRTGLLNVDEPELVAVLLSHAHASLHAALSPGSLDAPRARLLLRLLCALVVTNVLHASAALGALRGAIDAAQAAADAGAAAGVPGASWQPYTDFLAAAALCALPWGGAELAEGAPATLAALLDAAAQYEEGRPARSSPALRPFAAGVKPDDPLAE